MNPDVETRRFQEFKSSKALRSFARQPDLPSLQGHNVFDYPSMFALSVRDRNGQPMYSYSVGNKGYIGYEIQKPGPYRSVVIVKNIYDIVVGTFPQSRFHEVTEQLTLEIGQRTSHLEAFKSRQGNSEESALTVDQASKWAEFILITYFRMLAKHEAEVERITTMLSGKG